MNKYDDDDDDDEQQINQILFETVAAHATTTYLHSKHIQKKQKQNTHLQPTVPNSYKA